MTAWFEDSIAVDEARRARLIARSTGYLPVGGTFAAIPIVLDSQLVGQLIADQCRLLDLIFRLPALLFEGDLKRFLTACGVCDEEIGLIELNRPGVSGDLALRELSSRNESTYSIFDTMV